MKPGLKERVHVLRQASQVLRCHTLPTKGYTVGQHSFDALVLLLQLHPGASKELMKTVMYHDFAERYVGDIPYEFKRDFPDIMKQISSVEIDWDKDMGIRTDLTSEPEEVIWLHIVDIIEFWLWCMEEMLSGNKLLYPNYHNCLLHFAKHAPHWPSNVRVFIKEMKDWFEPFYNGKI